MTDQATTPPDVAPEVPEQSIDDRIGNLLNFGDEPEPTAQDNEEPSDEAPAIDDLAIGEEDAEGEQEEAPQGDEEVLIHNGQEKRVSKEQMRNLAQKGFDYEAQMTQLKSEKAQLSQFANELKARAEVQPQFVEALADYRATVRQLSEWQNVDWMRLAQEEPLDWAKYRSQYEALLTNARQAEAKLQDVDRKRMSADVAIDESIKQRERNALLNVIPEWRDETRYRKESSAVAGTLGDVGFSMEELNQVKLDHPPIYDHRFIALARLATIGARALKAREQGKAKVANSPAGARPGIAKPRDRMNEKAELTKRLHSSKDPQQRKQLMDAVLAKKLGF